MRTRRTVVTLLAATAGLLAATGLAGGTAAGAATPTSININAKCSRTSWANLQVAREDTGKLSIDFGVDMLAHKAGVVWKATVTDNRSTLFSGSVKTISDGSFSVSRLLTPLAGSNKVTGRAVNPATGETCTVTGTV